MSNTQDAIRATLAYRRSNEFTQHYLVKETGASRGSVGNAITNMLSKSEIERVRLENYRGKYIAIYRRKQPNPYLCKLRFRPGNSDAVTHHFVGPAEWHYAGLHF